MSALDRPKGEFRSARHGGCLMSTLCRQGSLGETRSAQRGACLMKSNSHPLRRESGFSLIASLILLVLVTLVAVSSMRTVSLQSRMSATTYDRNLAFQAAETGIREAESLAVVATEASFPAADCVEGYCAQPAPADPARWADDAFAGWRNSALAVSTGAAAPGAIIERNGEGDNWPGCGQQIPREPNCRTPRYRVTSRSTAEGRATVILQSDVATQ